jgi:hypothetical protein
MQREWGDDESPDFSVAIKTCENVGKVRNLVRTNHHMKVLQIALFTSVVDYSSLAWWNFTLTNSKTQENTKNV